MNNARRQERLRFLAQEINRYDRLYQRQSDCPFFADQSHALRREYRELRVEGLEAFAGRFIAGLRRLAA